jgi:hypothetical protein
MVGSSFKFHTALTFCDMMAEVNYDCCHHKNKTFLAGKRALSSVLTQPPFQARIGFKKK